MATLVPDDYKVIRKELYILGKGKEELKTLTTLPSETVLLSIFQSAEDRTVAGFLLFKADLETALNIPANAFSLQLAKKIYRAYLLWKLDRV